MMRNIDFLVSLIRKYGEDADPDNEEHVFNRDGAYFDLRRLRVMEDFQSHWGQMSTRIEDRFRETIGLMRALESAVAQGVANPAALAALCKAVRADYAMLLREFYAFDFRQEPDFDLDANLGDPPAQDRLGGVSFGDDERHRGHVQ